MVATLLKAIGIVKSYTSAAGTLDVLKGINLEIRDGEILAIMGSSGVGKSTLLNVIGLLDHVTAGDLELRLHDNECIQLNTLDRESRARLRNQHLGFVFQFYHLLPDLNVVENVLLPAMVRLSRREFRRNEAALTRRAVDLLRRVGVERDEHKPNMLSGGERQRVAIARALMNEPRLLLCDEPTGNLDTERSEQIHRLFKEINAELGTTMLIVTHDTLLAESLCHRTLHMRDGRFVAG